jgi:hypothetical protein
MPPQTNRFLEHLIDFLMPFFLHFAPSIEEARAEILETLASYGPRTRQEFLHAAQIIAFGLSTLDALSEAKITDMPPAMRLRYRGCANSLNRACQQNEKALAKLLTCEPADAAAPLSEPVNDISEGEIQQAVRQAKAKIEIIRKRLSNITTQPQDGSAMFNALFQPAPPPRSAAP